MKEVTDGLIDPLLLEVMFSTLKSKMTTLNAFSPIHRLAASGISFLIEDDISIDNSVRK